MKICDLYLKSVVVWVGDDDTVCVADGDVMRVLKLTGLAAHRAELGHKSAVALENLGWKKMLTLVWRTKNDKRLRCASEGQRDLDPVVFFVADVDESQWIGADAPGIVELPIVTSLEVIVSDVVIENS